MSGLSGVFAFSDTGKLALFKLPQALAAQQHRGSQASDLFLHRSVGFAHQQHTSKSLKPDAKQPFTDASGRYTLMLDGEIYNKEQLQAKLQQRGIECQTNSEIEVILQLYVQQGQAFLKKLRGSFVLAIYDATQESLFIARDRFGEKPLLYFKDNDTFLFASEMAALFALGVPREVDYTSLLHYLQLSYVPAPASMLQNVRKLLPGHALLVRQGRVQEIAWYRLRFNPEKALHNPLPYKQQQLKLAGLLQQAVVERLPATGPAGAFLSGGLDSSVVVALAAKCTPALRTFSVGFPDQPYFDETKYARLVAHKYKTDHTELLLRNEDLSEHISEMLAALSEPFADSSALAVFILSKHASRQVNNILSGDGADELFAGYNKHLAEHKVITGGPAANAVKQLGFLWKALPATSNITWNNKLRQLHRFATGAGMAAGERYWLWATWQAEASALALLNTDKQALSYTRLYQAKKNRLIEGLHAKPYSINNVLHADWSMVLANDMLPKVDLMGTANNLSIRSPFLDHRLVKFAFSLPASSKINSAIRKKIVQETFQPLLPAELFKRPKQGFEIPLMSFLKTEGNKLVQESLSDKFILDQNIFDVHQIRHIRERLNSTSAPYVQVQVWMLVVFQQWWKKYIKV